MNDPNLYLVVAEFDRWLRAASEQVSNWPQWKRDVMQLYTKRVPQ